METLKIPSALSENRATSVLSALRWYGEQGVQFLRRWHWLLLLIIATALATYGLALRRQIQQLNTKHPQLIPAPTVQGKAEARLKAFYDTLLPPDQINSTLANVLVQARNMNLAVSRSEYQWVADPHGQFKRVKIRIPISGDALVIQRFMEKLLVTNPALILESFSFKRSRIDSPNIEANLNLAILVKN